MFIDRSLGRRTVPNGLRAAGLHVVVLAEFYGVPNDEQISDERWLTDVGTRGWVALMADAKIRQRPAEREALRAARVRAFVVGGQLNGAQIVERVLANLQAITERCAQPGPFVYRVHATRLQRLSLD